MARCAPLHHPVICNLQRLIVIDASRSDNSVPASSLATSESLLSTPRACPRRSLPPRGKTAFRLRERATSQTCTVPSRSGRTTLPRARMRACTAAFGERCFAFLCCHSEKRRTDSRCPPLAVKLTNGVSGRTAPRTATSVRLGRTASRAASTTASTRPRSFWKTSRSSTRTCSSRSSRTRSYPSAIVSCFWACFAGWRRFN